MRFLALLAAPSLTAAAPLAPEAAVGRAAPRASRGRWSSHITTLPRQTR